MTPDDIDRIINSLPPDLRSTAKRMYENCPVTTTESKKPPPKELSSKTHLPTDMCRVSPFFPVARQKIGEADRIFERRIVIENSWGRLIYSGPKLTTIDEDILLAVLALLEDRNKQRIDTDEEGAKTYTYVGSIGEIIRQLGYTDGSANYARIKMSLTKLMSVVLTYETFRSGVDEAGKKKTASWKMDHILRRVEWTEDPGRIAVTVEKYFYETYLAGRITSIDLRRRLKLSSPVARSIMRFVSSHKTRQWEGHVKVLALAINLDMDSPMYQIRRIVKEAIAEAVEKRQLTPGSCIKKDTVKLCCCSVG